VASALLPLLLLQGAALPARAQERTVPAPKQVIYPGDIIRDSMLTDIAVDESAALDNSIVDNRAALIGKVASSPAQVTDADFAAAKASGFSEDQLFELVVSAAVGQSARLYEAGLAALAEATAGEEAG